MIILNIGAYISNSGIGLANQVRLIGSYIITFYYY